MKNFYLIGNDLDRSLSPYIHDWIYKFLDIKAEYRNKNIQAINFEMELSNIISKLKLGSIQGLNITSPYKIKIISPNIELSDDAQSIGAVNCINYKDNHLIGDNTDWIGFVQSINQGKVNLNNYDIKIIGAGGSARAIIYGLGKLGIEKFKIYNRTKTSIIVNGIRYRTFYLEELRESLSKNIFLINCIKPNLINNILTNNDLDSMQFFYDLNYNRVQFHETLEQKDIKVILGLDMLIYQAIKSIEIWLEYDFFDKIKKEEIKTYLNKKSLC